MDLDTAIKETSEALNLFLNNKFSEARAKMQPWAHQSMYHAVGYGTIMYLQAVMTFDSHDIEIAVETIKKAVEVCNRYRKKNSFTGSFSKMVRKPNFDSYSEEEIHAELCYAECLLERALLTFVQDENLISFIKGGLKIRACFQSYKECLQMLTQRSWVDSRQKSHFESGVRMGVGAFNLMISQLPSKVMKLLEFVGFSGNKQLGLQELERGCNLMHSLRAPLCSFILIAYHTVVTYVLGTADGDIAFADKILQPMLQDFPNGALFLFFAGRIEEIRGNIDEAILRFEESIDSQQEWRQFHHLCYWELMWCHSFKCDWLMACKYAEKLCKGSRWSKATYTYQKASFLLMCDTTDRSEDTHQHLNQLFSEVPALKQRIAGKSIPIEKFAVKKAKRYLAQGNRLTLPALELIYVWNGFSIIGKKEELLVPIMELVEKMLIDLEPARESNINFIDDYCLALLLKGMCLKCIKRTLQAEQCFKEVCLSEKKLKEDTYLVPYALVELALLHIQNEKYSEAKQLLEQAKTNYKSYSLESRLHFRIHSALNDIKSHCEQNVSSDDPFYDCTAETSTLPNETFSSGS